MRNARHPNLIEFVGLILENQRTFIVEGMFMFSYCRKALLIPGLLEYCSKESLADVLANPDIELAWIFRFSLINDLVSGKQGSSLKKPLHLHFA